jgi:hypothetical protein
MVFEVQFVMVCKVYKFWTLNCFERLFVFLKMCCLLSSCLFVCIFVSFKVTLCLPFQNMYVCDILGLHFALISLLEFVYNVCEGLLFVSLWGIASCLGLLSIIYLFWRSIIYWLLVCPFFMRVYVQHMSIVCLFVHICFWKFIIYPFICLSFRVISYVCLWKLLCVFVFEGLSENISLWGQLDQAFWSIKHVRWKEHGIVWYKKSYLTKETIIWIHACWLDIKMSSYN